MVSGNVADADTVIFIGFHLLLSITFRDNTHQAGLCSGLLRCGEIMEQSRTNPRHKNGNLRRKHRRRLAAMDAPCGICRGRLGPIHYDEPSDAQHPLSFVIDEIRPVSRWKEFGYDSPEAVAQDWDNLQAAHWICNQKKSNKIGEIEVGQAVKKINIIDGDW